MRPWTSIITNDECCSHGAVQQNSIMCDSYPNRDPAGRLIIITQHGGMSLKLTDKKRKKETAIIAPLPPQMSALMHEALPRSY